MYSNVSNLYFLPLASSIYWFCVTLIIYHSFYRYYYFLFKRVQTFQSVFQRFTNSIFSIPSCIRNFDFHFYNVCFMFLNRTLKTDHFYDWIYFRLDILITLMNYAINTKTFAEIIHKLVIIQYRLEFKWKYRTCSASSNMDGATMEVELW